jgi:uncharacterized membrane protein YgdD (TMEM256/DUF423 family)
VNRLLLLIGAVCGFLAVAFGAFGAHALRDQISPEMLAIYQTAVQYQMIHALALLFVAANYGKLHKWIGPLFVAGIVIFSGSLYALSLTGTRTLGAITPIGGLCFLGGWLLLIVSALKMSPTEEN